MQISQTVFNARFVLKLLDMYLSMCFDVQNQYNKSLYVFNVVNIKPNILSYRATIWKGSSSTESPPPLPLIGDTTYVKLADVNSLAVNIYLKTEFRWKIPDQILSKKPPYLHGIQLGVTEVSVSVTTQGMTQHNV